MAKRVTCILVGALLAFWSPSAIFGWRAICVLEGMDAKGTIYFKQQQVSAAISVAASVPPGGTVVHVVAVAIPTYVTAGRRTHNGNGEGVRSHTGEARFPHPRVW